MFEDVNISRRLKDSPLQNLTLEIFFDTGISLENLYGKLYSGLFENFCTTVQTLPLSQIPQIIRESDPNLKYQPIYRCEDNNHHVILLGQHSLAFEHLSPYSNWTDWSASFYPKIKSFLELGKIKSVNRLRLRSTDVFPVNVVEKLNINVSVNQESIHTAPLFVSTEIHIGDNKASFELRTSKFVPKLFGKNIQCSLTINSSKEFNDKVLLSFDDYKKEVELLHDNNKRVFWGLTEKLYGEEDCQ